MIDIHNHSLYGVDDGAKTIEESVELLKEAAESGVKAIILTPHYRYGMFPYSVRKVEENYQTLKKYAEEFGVKIYPGCEYHVDTNMIENLEEKRTLSLAMKDYVLTEYSFETDKGYIRSMSRELLAHGYIPVVAHAERYECFQKQPEFAGELQELGVMIQVNADSALGLCGRHMKKVCNKMLKNEWIDVIASDCHDKDNRANHMAKCRDYIEKKFGIEEAEKLFYINPGKVLKG